LAPSEWNKLAREKKEAERKLAEEKQEVERKMLAEKGMTEEQEVVEMMERPSEGKGKGVVRLAVGLPKVAIHGLAWCHIKSAMVVVDSNEEDDKVPVADLVPRAMPVTSLLKGRKVEVVLLPPQVTAGQGKSMTVLPCTARFLATSVTVPAISTMDDNKEEEGSGNDEMDVDELEGTPAVGKCKADEEADEPVPKQPKVHDKKITAVNNVMDDMLVEMQGAGEITKRYQAWLVVNAQPSNIVSFYLGLVFVC
jgi:hypothetical protein